MQAIQTRFIGPTNFRDSRYKAVAQAGSITLEADSRLNPEENHKRAALRLAQKFQWLSPKCTLAGGQLPNGDYAWVFAKEALEY